MVFSTDPHAEDIEAEYAALDRREVSSPNKLWNFWTLTLAPSPDVLRNNKLFKTIKI